jgi:hypothetical protein
MANWVGQLVLQRARILPADIDARNDEGLGSRIKPLWPYLWHADDAPPVAQNEQDMERFILFLDEQWSIVTNTDGEGGPLTVVVIDEVPTAFANKQYGDELIRIVGEIILRGRKYNWFVILGGQDWNKAAAGGTIRDQLSTRVFHQADRDQVRRFSGLGTKLVPPDVSNLEPGVAYVVGGGTQQKITVPFVTVGDFEAVASFLANAPTGELWVPGNELAPTQPNELVVPRRELGVASQFATIAAGGQRLNGMLISDEQVRDWVLEAMDDRGEIAREAAAKIVHDLCDAEGVEHTGRAWTRNKAWMERIVEEATEEWRRGRAG